MFYVSLHVKHLVMIYGSIKKLLSSEYNEIDDTVLVESQFRETDRKGKETLRIVQLGLTANSFIIASEIDLKGQDATTSDGSLLCRESSIIEILSLYPWDSVKLTVFKQSRKQILKATFINNAMRYFELRDSPKKKIFWSIWCIHIKELQSSKKKWPFSLAASISSVFKTKCRCRKLPHDPNCVHLRFVKHSENIYRERWKDKYLYLGSHREVEDKIRPVPVPGLGKHEEIKLLYLKPRYFGCWEQSEHWVQCGNSSLDMICQNDVKNVKFEE